MIDPSKIKRPAATGMVAPMRAEARLEIGHNTAVAMTYGRQEDALRAQ